MSRKELTKAIAYFRTSSMTNVGEDSDTLKRQREAVETFAKSAGYDVIAEYSDDGVRGSDPVDQRPGFAAMLEHIAGNGVRVIIVETASRFAGDLIVQETGWRSLRDMGIELIAVDSPDSGETLKALATGVAPADLADGLPIVAAVARWAAAAVAA